MLNTLNFVRKCYFFFLNVFSSLPQVFNFLLVDNSFFAYHYVFFLVENFFTKVLIFRNLFIVCKSLIFFFIILILLSKPKETSFLFLMFMDFSSFFFKCFFFVYLQEEKEIIKCKTRNSNEEGSEIFFCVCV